jgi:membrane peptidoglycan carboxypeptidase
MTEEPEHPAEDRVGQRLRRLLSEVEAENQRQVDSLPGAKANQAQAQPDMPDGSTLLLPDETTDKLKRSSASPPSYTTGETVASLEVPKAPGAAYPDPALADTQPVKPAAQLPVGAGGSKEPAITPEGASLPRRVDQVDVDATRVSPAAYAPPRRPAPAALPPPPPTHPADVRQSIPYPKTPQKSTDWRKGAGCLLRISVAAVFVLVITFLCAASFVFFQYFRIRSTLPDITQLEQKASQFETTRILDRNGNLLYEILDPNAGRRTYVPIEKISPYMLAATIATEDKEFYNHPGFDIWAIFRAFYQNYQSGETVSGASTITQQLARNLLFTQEERSRRTYDRKIREAVLAAEITRVYSKEKILELYLNENNYGSLAYGVEAAAETYFNTSAEKLTLGQAAFLAGLPQSPAIYDIFTNREATLKRQEDVLVLMYELSQEQGCITVSNTPQPVCMDPVSAASAANEVKGYSFTPPAIEMRYPHWVNYIRTLLEEQYDPQTIYRSGFTVYTTLDPGLQDAAQRSVAEQVANLGNFNARSGALVAIQPSSGEILAMVGSADFYNEDIDGQVNMAIAPRQPGSAIKPITYLAAFEKGWTPATLLWDVPSEFTPSGKPDDPSRSINRSTMTAMYTDR